MTIILEVKSLYKSYKNKQILKDINLKVNKGDVYGLIGHNGAGKSTMIKTILGLVKRDSGEIYFEGELMDKSKYIGATIEEPAFYEYLSGYTNLKLHTNLHGLPKERIVEVLNLVKLENVKNKKVSTYSMGMKQRLAVARAFINSPKLVILDEPTNGLDPQGVLDMRKFIKEQSEKGVTFIYCSHILSEVQSLCNRIGLIKDGVIVVQDNTENLLNEEKNMYIIECEDKEGLIKHLKGNDFKARLINNDIEVELGNNSFSELNKLVVNSGIIVDSMSKKESSLESLFTEKEDILDV